MKIASIQQNNIQYYVKPSFRGVTPASVSAPINIGTGLMSAAVASAIAARTIVNHSQKEITTEDIEKKLLKFGYEKNEQRNCYVRKSFTDKEREPYLKENGKYVDIVLSNITKLSQDKIAEFKNFIDIDKKIGHDMYNNHFDKLVSTFCVLNFNNKLSTVKDKNLYKMVANIVTNDISTESVKSIFDYKGKAYEGGVATQAQKYLRGKTDSATDEVKAFINNVSACLDTQKIPAGTKLYRGERFGVLSNVKLQNGQSADLGQMMKIASESKNYDEIQKVKEFIQDNEITANQSGFMSTSITSDAGFDRDGWIFWELETEPDTKGMYIDGLSTSFYTFQDEVLLQKNSKIKIQSAEYDSNKNIWKLKANVSN